MNKERFLTQEELTTAKDILRKYKPKTKFYTLYIDPNKYEETLKLASEGRVKIEGLTQQKAKKLYKDVKNGQNNRNQSSC